LQPAKEHFHGHSTGLAESASNFDKPVYISRLVFYSHIKSSINYK